jgi:hypothetical protein
MIGPLSAAGADATSVEPGGSCANANSRAASASACCLFDVALAAPALAAGLLPGALAGKDDAPPRGELAADPASGTGLDAHPARTKESHRATPEALIRVPGT